MAKEQPIETESGFTWPVVNNTYENAHQVLRGDPRIDGPYMDDGARDMAYREQRMEELAAAEEGEEVEVKIPMKKATSAKKTEK